MQVNRALKRMKRMFLRSVTDLLKSGGSAALLFNWRRAIRAFIG
jgi:hypothetical protein